MSLYSLIINFLTYYTDNKQTIYDLNNNKYISDLSKYYKGCIHKLTKPELLLFIKTLKSYKIDFCCIHNKNIIPDAEQMQIINAPINKNIRIIAGPGTGKTTIMTCRIKYLLDQYTTPNFILVLTFNVESRKKLEKLINKLIGFEIMLEIRTFDSFCFKIKKDFLLNDIVDNSLNQLASIGRKIMEKYGSVIAKQYKYIFSDEFHDINENQFKILVSFAKNVCKLIVIGDDCQNIYQFKGTDNH